MGREATVTTVACILESTVNATYLKVRRLERAGLVRVAREERRAGRAVKHYTAVAPRLFVPFEVMHLPDLEDFYLRNQEEQTRLFTRALLETYRREWGEPTSLGQSHYRTADGSTLTTFGPAPGVTWSSLQDDKPATLLNGGSVFLTAQEAKVLQRDLYLLHTRYSQPGPDRRPYRLHLGLTPDLHQDIDEHGLARLAEDDAEFGASH